MKLNGLITPEVLAARLNPNWIAEHDIETSYHQLSLWAVAKLDSKQAQRILSKSVWWLPNNLEPGPYTLPLRAPVLEALRREQTTFEDTAPNRGGYYFWEQPDHIFEFWRYLPAPENPLESAFKPPPSFCIGYLFAPSPDDWNEGENSAWRSFESELGKKRASFGSSFISLRLQDLLTLVREPPTTPESLASVMQHGLDGLLVFTHGVHDFTGGELNPGGIYPLSLRELFDALERINNQSQKRLRWLGMNACEMAEPLLELLEQPNIEPLLHPLHFGATVLAGRPSVEFAAAWTLALLNEWRTSDAPSGEYPFLRMVHEAKRKVMEKHSLEAWRVLTVMRHPHSDALPTPQRLALEQLMWEYLERGP